MKINGVEYNEIIQKETILLLEEIIKLFPANSLEERKIRIQKQHSIENLGTEYVIDVIVNDKIIKFIPLYVSDKYR